MKQGQPVEAVLGIASSFSTLYSLRSEHSRYCEFN